LRDIFKMETQNVHFRHCMLFLFNQGKNATEAATAICSAYGENAVTPRVCQKWFSRFREGNFDLEDRKRAGRPRELDCEYLEEVVGENPLQSTRKLACVLDFNQSTILRRLYEIGKKCKLGKWVPYTLSETSKMQRLNICISLWAKIQKKSFLWKIVTGDEKWIFFHNPHNEKQWLSPGQASVHTPLRNIHGSKVMLCVWWDMKGLLYYELLEEKQTVNAALYSQQLKRLSEKITENRPWNGHGKRKITLLHDNARPHVAIQVKNTINELGWDLLPHPAYSPDLAPTDYHLFRSLEHSLRNKSFANSEEVRKHLDSFFESKPKSFYADGIRKLPERWQMVIDAEGNYFDD